MLLVSQLIKLLPLERIWLLLQLVELLLLLGSALV
jgi:hypothetical protein